MDSPTEYHNIFQRDSSEISLESRKTPFAMISSAFVSHQLPWCRKTVVRENVLLQIQASTSVFSVHTLKMYVSIT